MLSYSGEDQAMLEPAPLRRHRSQRLQRLQCGFRERANLAFGQRLQGKKVARERAPSGRGANKVNPQTTNS